MQLYSAISAGARKVVGGDYAAQGRASEPLVGDANNAQRTPIGEGLAEHAFDLVNCSQTRYLE